MLPSAERPAATMPRLDETQSPLAREAGKLASRQRASQHLPGNSPPLAHAISPVRQQDHAVHAKLPVVGAASISGNGKRVLSVPAPRNQGSGERPALQIAVRDGVSLGKSPAGAAAQSQNQGGMLSGGERADGLRAGPGGSTPLDGRAPGTVAGSGVRGDRNGIRVHQNGAGPSSVEDPGPSNGAVKEFVVGDRVAALATFDQSYREHFPPLTGRPEGISFSALASVQRWLSI